MEVLRPPLLAGVRLSLIAGRNLPPPPHRNCPADVVAARRLQRRTLYEKNVYFGPVFPCCGAEQVKHRPDLSADENSVLFAARDIFRLKLASNE